MQSPYANFLAFPGFPVGEMPPTSHRDLSRPHQGSAPALAQGSFPQCGVFRMCGPAGPFPG